MAAADAQRQRDSEAREAQRQKLHTLIKEFLHRMELAGYPGTFDHKVGRVKKVKAWGLCYEDAGDGRARSLLLTIDGRILQRGPLDRHRYPAFELVSYTRFYETVLDDTRLARLAQSMAELLATRHSTS